jgi:hypothetical protein
MKLSLLAIPAIAVGLLGSASVWSAEPARYRSPDPDISRVEYGGVWSEGKHSGGYRAVVRTDCTGDDCYDELFVEWLQPVNSKRVLVGSKRVAQIGPRKQIVNVEFVGIRGENHLEVEHRTGADRTSDRWMVCLSLDGPNRYDVVDGRCRR